MQQRPKTRAGVAGFCSTSQQQTSVPTPLYSCNSHYGLNIYSKSCRNWNYANSLAQRQIGMVGRWTAKSSDDRATPRPRN
eukprot:scaffold182069_cov14-Tisochrysis_lutea.AAC.1